MAKAFDKYFGLIVTVAIVAVIVSQRSKTTEVLQSLGSAMSSILGTIVLPIGNGEKGNG